MFSLDRFYNIIHNNLVNPLPNARSIYFYPFGTYRDRIIVNKNFHSCCEKEPIEGGSLLIYFIDQEPLYNFDVLTDKSRFIFNSCIIANSEHSAVKTQYIADNNRYYDWYYFFHGFLALDWYRDFQYVNPTSFDQFDKVFICYNHLVSNYRSYRLHLGSNLISQDLVKHGLVSLFLSDEFGTWQDAVNDPNTLLDPRACAKITAALSTLTQPLTIDTINPNGTLSATVDFDQLTSALFHVVTETVYFLPKLHLTEKIFKPIIAHRPFILVAAPGNLAYLKRYGFKTFDRWIDESYDDEQDHYIRIEKITEEIAKLCAMEPADLIMMYKEMQEVLDYNFDHFYGEFKNIIVNEMVDNFADVLDQINSTREEGHLKYHMSPNNMTIIKKRLSQ